MEGTPEAGQGCEGEEVGGWGNPEVGEVVKGERWEGAGWSGGQDVGLGLC